MKEQRTTSNFDVYIRKLDTLNIKDLTTPVYNLFYQFSYLVMSNKFTDIVKNISGDTDIRLLYDTKKDENKVRFISNIFVDTIIKE